MNDVMRSELGRNLSGYVLLFTGVALILCSHNALAQDSGKGLIGASLLAFQAKRNPDGDSQPGK